MSKQTVFKRPDVVGWFIPPYRGSDQDNRVLDLKTGELVLAPSMTKQEFRDECDINNIIRQYNVTGVLQHVRDNTGLYADLPDGLDYQTALNTVLQGQAAFEALPASIRNRFNNDPAEFLEFFDDPANLEEARKLGLANLPPAKDEKPAPVKPGAVEKAQEAPKE